MDVKNAFLHGDINSDVYIEQPPGFVKDPNLVCKLNKAIYGLKRSPLLWNKCINDFLVDDLSFKRSDVDICMYSKFEDDNVTVILVYVDDILIASNKIEILEVIKMRLKSRFEMTDLGKVKTFLGIEINYENNVMTLCQEKFVKK